MRKLDLHHRHRQAELVGQRRYASGVLALHWWISHGSAADPPGQLGRAQLLTSSVQRGAAGRGAAALAEDFESRGAIFGCGASEDATAFWLRCVTTDALPLLERLEDMVRQPDLQSREVRLEQELTLQALDQQQEDPFQLASDALRRLLYGSGGYGHGSLGRKSDITGLSPSLLRIAHDQWAGSPMVIAAAGSWDAPIAARLKGMVDTCGGVNGNVASLPCRPVAKVGRDGYGNGMAFVPQHTEQVVLMLGASTCGLADPDHGVLRLLKCHLGSGMSSRLFRVIREDRALAYDVGASLSTRRQAAPFVCHLATSQDRALEALDVLLAEWHHLLDVPLNGAELQLARAKHVGQERMLVQTSLQVAAFMALLRGHQLDVDFREQQQRRLDRHTATDCHLVARRWLTAPRLAAVGPPALEDVLQQRWTQSVSRGSS